METTSLQFMHHRLREVREQRLYRQLRVVSSGAKPWMEIEGQRVLNLSSNNYLGLATRPELQAATAAMAVESGSGAGSSRLIVGSLDCHQVLETRLARFKQTESALLFTSGYTANVGVITSLVGPSDVILSDELNHASIIDGCRLSRAECKIFPHRNLSTLEEFLASLVHTGHRGKVVVVTDSIFSMDGDVAPLAEIAQLCRRYDALLVVDEAHATGCIGPGGRGLAALAGVKYEAMISVGTLSKALGSFGAFVAGPQIVREYLINLSRNFIFTTALPPPVVAASLAALDIVEREPELIERLQSNGAFFRRGLQQRGFNTLTSETHIVPILVADSALALEMTTELLRNGIFAVAIRPPTVPPGTARIRASVMATHTQDDLAYALDSFERVGRRLGLV